MAGSWETEDGAFDPIGKVMAILDIWLIPIGWTFGLLFTGLGVIALPIFIEGGDPALLALGVALLGLGRAAAAATYARRHRCGCDERDSGEGEAAESQRPPKRAAPIA